LSKTWNLRTLGQREEEAVSGGRVEVGITWGVDGVTSGDGMESRNLLCACATGVLPKSIAFLVRG